MTLHHYSIDKITKTIWTTGLLITSVFGFLGSVPAQAVNELKLTQATFQPRLKKSKIVSSNLKMESIFVEPTIIYGQPSSDPANPSPVADAFVADYNLQSILTKRLPSGAISTYNSSNEVKINPYFQNLAICGLATEAQFGNYPNRQELIDTAWKALDWYKSKQDPITGYIYDYNVNGSVETNSGQMDSVDSYIGTYFVALQCAYKASGNSAKLQSHLPTMLKAYQAISTIYDPVDNLYIAKPSWQVKYLMDNVELARGIKEASNLFSILGQSSQSLQANNDYQRLITAIESRFWDSSTNDYRWAIAGNVPNEVLYPSNWSKCYADAKANLWATMWLDVQTASRKTALTNKFDSLSKNTLDTGLVECQYNPSVGIAMSKANQNQLANSYYNFGKNAIATKNIGGIYTSGHDGLFLILKHKLNGKTLVI